MIRSLAFVVVLFFTMPAFAEGSERFLDIREVTSPGGISAWLVEDHAVPVIAIEFSFENAGSVNDPDNRQGIAQILSNTLDEGAADLDSQTFQKTLADNSISLSYQSGRDNFHGSLKMLTRHQDLALNLLRLSLTAPRFDAEPLQRMKDANISRIRTAQSDPEWVAARLMNDTAYAGHVYARNSGGTISNIQAVTAENLRNFVKGNLTRDRLHIAVAGDIDAGTLGAVLDTVFGSLPEKAVTKDIPDLKIQNTASIILMKMDQPQTIIQRTQDGTSRSDPDWHAAQVMNFILGSSGFGSRLMEEIREKRGLTYGVYTNFLGLDHAPTLSLQTSTKNNSVKDVLGLIDEEWTRMRDSDVSAKELDDAKSYLIGSMPLALTSTDTIAGMMISMQLDDLPSTYLDTIDQKISAVTMADVRRVAQKILKPGQQVTILVGNPDQITPTKTVEILPNVE
jgi:zinc protease